MNLRTCAPASEPYVVLQRKVRGRIHFTNSDRLTCPGELDATSLTLGRLVQAVF
jgi:hypothetical protein